MKLKLKKIKIGFNINIMLKLIYPLMFVAIIVGICFMSMFLYNDFYKTITHAEEVSILRSEVAPEIFQIKIFDSVVENLNLKMNQEKIDRSTINNAFILVPQELITEPEIQ